jgi:hypothetical protein
MNRLDALKAHLPSVNYPLVTLEQVERLVAVVEAIANPEEDLTWGQMERIRKARAYWLEDV